ncbi:MAG: PDZ domain-containing protein [Acidobacteria bacterium]|nr:MAG: PDZ domain-containing protein [Acidobacteriota bacterium]REJ98324.1 MAG: PDZ domain-containing protein [Acidobacteriota bacterium]REK17068.1 MAG: PDZ domain-containing protein [Acidobacteriota bacterium]REK42978.1 MAG: PDZ domain-containing protein [Acidobacteriota bacterium]
MLRKVSVVILLSTLLTAISLAQDTAPEPDEEKALGRVFSMAFGGGSYLGIEIRDVTSKNYSELGLTEVRGVHVSRVVDDSPAAKAGLREGDVIVRFDGQTVTSTKKLTRLISEVAPDHTVDMTVVRDGGELRLAVTVGKRDFPGFSNGTFVFPAPRPPAAPGAPDAPEPPKAIPFPMPNIQIAPPTGLGENFVWAFGNRRTIGVSVNSLSKQLGDYFGVEEGKGLLVTSVEDDSPAAKAGIQAGDVIVDVDGSEIGRMNDLVKALNSEKEGDVTVTVIRDRSRRTFTVTPEKREGSDMYFNKELLEPLKRLTPKTNIRVSPATPSVRIAPRGRVVE